MLISLSKTLVQKYGANTVCLKNLNGVSFERTDLPKAVIKINQGLNNF